jgi:similar to stage IV sporulation protein
VLAGEVLIAGMTKIEAPQYSDKDLGYSQVRAAGSVWAETRRTLTASIPLETQVKRYTGAEKTRLALTLFGRRLNFYQNSGIPGAQYDKISETKALTLPGGRRLPIALVRVRCRAYDLQTAAVDRDAAQALLEQRLEEELSALLGQEGEVLEREVTAREAGGLLTVTLQAACREQIGQSVPSSGPVEPPAAEDGTE